jgi:hypothetical protein
VPNIRFNVSKTIEMVYKDLDAANKAEANQVLQKMAENDTDFDAKFYAQKTLESVSTAIAA